MGFSGGGSNVLKPHTHNGLVSQDGGALDMDNVTQAQLTSGDIVYSDGVHLQRLAIGAANTSLQSNGSVPGWQSAGAAARTILDSQTITTLTSTVTYTPTTPIDDSTYQKIQLVFTGNTGSTGSISAFYFRLNSGLADSNYNQNGIEVTSGAASYVDKNPQSGGDDYLRITDQLAVGNNYPFQVTIDINTIPTGETSTVLHYDGASFNRWDNGAGYITGMGSTISRIQCDLQGSGAEDMQFTVYGIAY